MLLIRLSICSGWSAPLLFACNKTRCSWVEARITLYIGKWQITKALIRLRVYTGLSAPLLFTCNKIRFSCIKAHITVYIYWHVKAVFQKYLLTHPQTYNTTLKLLYFPSFLCFILPLSNQNNFMTRLTAFDLTSTDASIYKHILSSS